MSNSAWRMAAGGRIDRSRPLTFTFDGRTYRGYAGDTLASALLANGERILGRSFKLHRPRGLLGAWSEEPNAIVQLGRGARTVPNAKATQVELYEGLQGRSVNCWPSARCDLLSWLQCLGPFLPAGFYYKTFKWPSWGWYEGMIRRAAGLGIAPANSDPDRYDERYEHCDVLVVGAGPAGLAAAAAAARAGARVVLADERPVSGGALQWEDHRIDGLPAPEWAARVERELRAMDDVRVLARTTAFGYYDHNLVALCERRDIPTEWGARERLWHVRASQVVLATGAIERPVVFAGNDRPGVMLASAAMSYAVQFAVRPGRRAVVVASTDSAYEAAAALHDREVPVAAIVDARQTAGAAMELARQRKIPVLSGHAPVRVRGGRAVRAIEVYPLAAEPANPRKRVTLECDLVCVSGGWTPTVHLYSQAGGRLRYDATRAALVPDGCTAGATVAGAAAGDFALADCLERGYAAGREAARKAGHAGDAGRAPGTASSPRAGVQAFWASPASRRGKAWVDLQNDVTHEDIVLAVRENMVSVEHLKRYTTTGMAVDQGKTGNMNALALLAGLRNCGIGALGATTFRPPYDPVTLGALAGRRVGAQYRPERRTPLDRWHAAHSAVMEDFGGWLRPAFYAGGSTTRNEAARREQRAARTAVSLFDGCPLGKIEVRGRDAADFLDRMYANDMRSLRTGLARYGLLLNEHGVVADDGVCMRLADDRFFLTTTSGGIERTFSAFEGWLQCEWPELQVLVTNVTSAWASVAVAGPRARELLRRLDTDVDLSREAFPHMGVRVGRLEGVRALIARVGYTGELSFELYVPSGHALALWERLLDAGGDLGVQPIGIDALQGLRTEKGYLHIGTDTDGNTLPRDVGLGKAVAAKAGDFVGRRSLYRPEALRDGRLELVGIAARDPAVVLPTGAHVLAGEAATSDGFVTSSCLSEALGRGVALGLVRSGRSRLGEAICVYSEGRRWPARVASPAWYDPDGERLRA